MGSSPRDHGPGRQYLGFIFIQWGVVLEPAGPDIAPKFSSGLIHF